MPVPLFIIGCCHQAQIDVDSIYRDARRELRRQLTDLIDHHGVRFIGEEAKQGRTTIAETIASSRGLRYVNIDIPLEVQAQIHHQEHTRYNEEQCVIEDLLETDQYAKAWNLVREFHMFWNALEELGKFLEPSILVVGLLHLAPLAALFNNESWLTVEQIRIA